jgi:hypothetical protein
MAGMGLFLDRSKIHDDLRLLNVAMKRRWPISEDFMETIVFRLESIIANGEDDELALKAIAQVRQMEGQNQRDEQHKAVIELERIRARLSVVLDQSSVGHIGENAVDSNNSGVDGKGQGQREEADGAGCIDEDLYS